MLSTANIDNLHVSGIATFSNSQISGINRIIGYNNTLSIQNNSYGTGKIYFSSDGNIGVGTENPQSLLDVAGTMHVSGATVFGNTVDVQDL